MAKENKLLQEETRTVQIMNDLGLHLRAAGVLVQLASNFNAEVWIEFNDRCANGKSIMSVLSLAAGCGSELTIRCEGSDASNALDALVRLIENKFEE